MEKGKFLVSFKYTYYPKQYMPTGFYIYSSVNDGIKEYIGEVIWSLDYTDGYFNFETNGFIFGDTLKFYIEPFRHVGVHFYIHGALWSDEVVCYDIYEEDPSAYNRDIVYLEDITLHQLSLGRVQVQFSYPWNSDFELPSYFYVYKSVNSGPYIYDGDVKMDADMYGTTHWYGSTANVDGDVVQFRIDVMDDDLDEIITSDSSDTFIIHYIAKDISGGTFIITE
jgi:hypothetical protein